MRVEWLDVVTGRPWHVHGETIGAVKDKSGNTRVVIMSDSGQVLSVLASRVRRESSPPSTTTCSGER